MSFMSHTPLFTIIFILIYVFVSVSNISSNQRGEEGKEGSVVVAAHMYMLHNQESLVLGTSSGRSARRSRSQ